MTACAMAAPVTPTRKAAAMAACTINDAVGNAGFFMPVMAVLLKLMPPVKADVQW
jgi:hypothetical protein